MAQLAPPEKSAEHADHLTKRAELWQARLEVGGASCATHMLVRTEDFDFAAAEECYEAELAKAQIRVDRMARAPLLRF